MTRATAEERAFLLECAGIWDRYAVSWEKGIASLEIAVTDPVGRVPCMMVQLAVSTPLGFFASPVDAQTLITHSRRLAARCRTLATMEEG